MCRVLSLLAAGAILALTSSPGLAQQGAPKPGTGPTASTMDDALALFARVCLAALVRGETAHEVAAREVRGAAPVPQNQLRSNEQVRETAAWIVQGAHRLSLMEPRSQCIVLTAGVDPDAFLAESRAIMQRPDTLPGWVLRGEPRSSSSPRPFGTLTYVRAHYVRLLPLPGGPPQGGPTPLPAANLVASAAHRTDGRPNTAVISTEIEPAPPSR